MSTEARVHHQSPPEITRQPVVLQGATDVDLGNDYLRVAGTALAINEALPGLVLHEGTALLLDVNNLYRRADDNDFKIDYVRLKSIFESRCDLRFCAAFSAINRADPKAVGWATYMANQGYQMFTKDLKQYTNKFGNVISKGNMDMEIAIEALSLSSAFAHIIIGTCDGDFVPLLDKLREGHFRKVSVLGTTNSTWTGMSRTLVNSADNFYDMTAIRNHIAYTGQRYD